MTSAARINRAGAREKFEKWMGAEYDLQALDAVLATAAGNQLEGDPVWLLLLSGSGNAKTETVGALSGAGAIAVSTITSPGALLSATAKPEVTEDATGGLLRQVGSAGILVIKDVTSILSANRAMRAEVLAALREVYDGSWVRHVGTDGGRTLEWRGRIVTIGAVTTAWDAAHAVIASMGDRFVIVRMDSTTGRQSAGKQSIANTGHEVQMRAELSRVVSNVLANLTTAPDSLTDEEIDQLLAAADLVTRARTAVERDYRGEVIDAHAPEMPTRFAKQLGQLVRGGVAIGMERDEAMKLAIRCARDSMPPIRLAIIDDVAAHACAATRDVRKRLNRPRATIERELQALQMLGVLTVEEEETMWSGRDATIWRYSLADGIDPSALVKSVPEMSVSPHKGTRRQPEPSRTTTDISGTDPSLRALEGNSA